MGQEPVGLDASAMWSMLGLSPHIGMTWPGLKLLPSPRCPTLVRSQEEALYNGATTFPENTACSRQKLYLQDSKSQSNHTLWKNSLPSSPGNLLLPPLFRLKQGKCTSKKPLPSTLPIKKHEVTTSLFSTLPTPFPCSESSLGAWLSSYTTDQPQLLIHLSKH